MVDKSKIDLGCGQNKKDGYFGIDVADVEGVDLVHDLTVYPWPIDDNSVDKIHCSHYMEHIPHVDVKGIIKQSNSFAEFKEKLIESKDGFITFVNELYRILKIDGVATVIIPHYMSIRAFGDPTHTRYIGDFSFYYLNKEWRDSNELSHYGINCDFDMKLQYFVNNEMTLKSEEVRNKAFQENWNAIDDLKVKMIKI